jgi:phosphatidylglycerophosphate synthase
VTSQEGQSVLSQNPVFKSSEFAELADVYFFRPLGAILARLAAVLRLTPIQVTILGALVGIAGGALLFDERLGLMAFVLLIVHGIIDSADGQLARMTNRVTELGRVLDGVAGYVTHAAIYLAVAAGMIHRGGDPFVTILLMLIAAVSNTMHAQLYEYFRPAYVMVVEKGRLRQDDPSNVPMWVRPFYGLYLAAQRRLIGLHPSVLAALLSRSDAGQLRDDDRARYRQCFRGTARGWRLLGDNTRFYLIGILALLHQIDLFFLIILGPMNVLLIVLQLWQRKTDRRFLASL